MDIISELAVVIRRPTAARKLIGTESRRAGKRRVDHVVRVVELAVLKVEGVEARRIWTRAKRVADERNTRAASVIYVEVGTVSDKRVGLEDDGSIGSVFFARVPNSIAVLRRTG